MLRRLFQATFFSNRLFDYLISLSLFLLFILIIYLCKVFILRRLKKWAEKTTTTLDNFLVNIFQSYLYPLLYFGVFYLSIRNLTLNTFLNKIINILGLALLTIFVIRLFVAIVTYIFHTYWIKKKEDTAKERGFKGLLSVIKVIIWGLGIVFLLDNLGFKISTVIAGLGIGGVAVALAAQTILGDLFSYFAILFDRPFEIGDFIVVEEFMGTIEHIGIKTTRIRSLGGEQIVFSNADLTNSRMRNYKRMDRRRVIFKLGVTYQMSLKQVKEIPLIVKGIIEKVKDTLFDRVHFSSFGDSSLVFEIVYYVLSSDYNKYMDVQQEINLAIKEEFEKRGIEFAYPTQTLFINK